MTLAIFTSTFSTTTFEGLGRDSVVAFTAVATSRDAVPVVTTWRGEALPCITQVLVKLTGMDRDVAMLMLEGLSPSEAVAVVKTQALASGLNLHFYRV